MMKASHLVKQNEYEECLCIKNYKIQLDKCLIFIHKENKAKKSDTYYRIPISVSDPYYYQEKCLEYLHKNLRLHEFYTRQSSTNNLEIYISWNKNDVLKIKQELEKERYIEMEKVEREKQIQENEEKERKKGQIKWHPKSAISELKLTTKLMKDNPKYSHLKSIKKTK